MRFWGLFRKNSRVHPGKSPKRKSPVRKSPPRPPSISPFWKRTYVKPGPLLNMILRKPSPKR